MSFEQNATYRDIDLSALQRILANDGQEAVREAIRRIEEANRVARDGGSADEVVAEFEQARDYLETAKGWAR